MSDFVPQGTSPGGQRSVGTDLPVAMVFSTTLNLNSVNRPTEQLYFKNPYRAPLWVDEFQFLVQNTVSATLPLSLFSMRLKINNKYIVDDFVPLSLLGPHTDFTEEIQISPTSYSLFWRLSKAMWLDELDDISMELKFNGNLNVFSTAMRSAIVDAPPVVTVTLKGRSTINAHRPKQRYMPFNAIWGPELLETVASTESNLRSPDSALRNGKNSNAVITRILSQVTMAPYSSSGGATSNYAGNTDLLLNLRISHSQGNYIVKDLTPYFELFQNKSRALDLKFILQPKEFLTVELQTKTFVPVGYAETMAPLRYLLAFGLQGYTVEALS